MNSYLTHLFQMSFLITAQNHSLLWLPLPQKVCLLTFSSFPTDKGWNIPYLKSAMARENLRGPYILMRKGCSQFVWRENSNLNAESFRPSEMPLYLNFQRFWVLSLLINIFSQIFRWQIELTLSWAFEKLPGKSMKPNKKTLSVPWTFIFRGWHIDKQKPGFPAWLWQSKQRQGFCIK